MKFDSSSMGESSTACQFSSRSPETKFPLFVAKRHGFFFSLAPVLMSRVFFSPVGPAAELGGAQSAMHSDSTLELILERKDFKLRERCRETSGLTVSLTKRYGDQLTSRTRRNVGRFVESSVVQKVILVLFLFDIALVLTELIIESSILTHELRICEAGCHSRHSPMGNHSDPVHNETDAHTAAMTAHARKKHMRVKAFYPEEGSKRVRTEAPAHGDEGEHVDHGNETDAGLNCEAEEALVHRLEVTEGILHWISLSVLFVFMLELFVLFLCFGYYFFLHVLYIS